MTDFPLPPREFKDLDDYYRNTEGGPSDARKAADDLANNCLNEPIYKDLIIPGGVSPGNHVIHPKQLYHSYSTSDHSIRETHTDFPSPEITNPDSDFAQTQIDDSVPIYNLSKCSKVSEVPE